MKIDLGKLERCHFGTRGRDHDGEVLMTTLRFIVKELHSDALKASITAVSHANTSSKNKVK